MRGVRSLSWEDTLEEGMAAHSSILALRIPMDRGAWWAAVRGITKCWTQVSCSDVCIFNVAGINTKTFHATKAQETNNKELLRFITSVSSVQSLSHV